MARYKHPSRKKRLAKAGKQTRWAPVWTIPKRFGKGRVLHPSVNTRVKRHWRRTRTKL